MPLETVKVASHGSPRENRMARGIDTISIARLSQERDSTESKKYCPRSAGSRLATSVGPVTPQPKTAMTKENPATACETAMVVQASSPAAMMTVGMTPTLTMPLIATESP